MSAPIDDLLYGGDDSGDEDDLNAATPAAVPLGSFSAPLPSTAISAPLGAPAGVLAPPPAVTTTKSPAPTSATVSGGLGTTTTSPAASVALPPPTSLSATPVSSSAAGVSALKTPTVPPGGPTAAAAVAATGVKPPGSGHQMFQQMFALLKQMLPPEQYAALHSEMRNGNGNDIKSIVDIIKRIAGDAIFASVIQKMDLTRTQSAAAGSLGIIKPEPGASSSAAAAPAPLTAMPPAGAGGAVASTHVPPGVRPAIPGTSGANVLTTVPLAAVSAAPTATQRPTLGTPAVIKAEIVAPTTTTTPTPLMGVSKSPLVPAASASAAAAPTAPVVAVAMPSASSLSTGPTGSSPSATASPIPAAAPTSAPSTTASAPAATSKQDTLEKIQFAKKLLFHASTCVLPPGVCKVKKCDDVRRVFKHSVSCGGARGCGHCKQLKALVEYHAKECLVAVADHCKIPFCDSLRRINAAARARAASIGSTSSMPSASTGAPTSTLASGAAMSDDDEDNTPLASAVTKVKKNSKAKSPKASPAPSAATATAAKKKASASASSSSSATAAKPSTPSTAAAQNAEPGASASGASSKPKAAVSANLTMEYGRLLQLILHVEKCKTSTCFVGEECAESKALLRQINSPDAPARAQTYKKVYAHYKVCVAKKNTQNCPMCKIGLLPLVPGATSGGGGTVATGTTATTPAPAASVTPTLAPSAAPATSPSVASLKRSASSAASPRSPSKKPRSNSKSSKSSTAESDKGHEKAHKEDTPASDLAQASVNDLRKEADVLTHTAIELNAERRIMMDGTRTRSVPELLRSTKDDWAQNDLFHAGSLQAHMTEIARRQGVTVGGHACDVMAHALQEYLKQVLEELVEVSRQRGDALGQALDAAIKKDYAGGTTRELTSTDILRVSCENSFTRLWQDDLALRAKLLEDAKKDELAERERAKKRKKVDRVKLQAQEEKDEAEMDIDELATKDLKDRLLQDDKDGLVHVDGRVNESLTAKYTRRADDEVTMADATYWLLNQKPHIDPKLFVRAEAARIVTKSLL